MGNYVTTDQLKASTPGDDAASVDAVWEALASTVSRLFDRECEVPDGFFDAAPAVPGLTTRTVRGTGTEFIKLFPYIAGSISAITIDGEAITVDDSDVYYESEGYLVFVDRLITHGAIVSVTARYGFDAIPPAIVGACIEQGLYMWRKKDLSFADISGVSAQAVTQEMTPTFAMIVKRYREMYGQFSHFA